MTAESSTTPPPPNGEWFIAEIVILHTIGDNEDDYLLHNNFVLIRATSAQEAQAKAESRGRAYEDKFLNPNGATVLVQFQGLQNLYHVEDELEDGAELLYEKFELSSASQCAAYVRPPSQFAVFRQSPTNRSTPTPESGSHSQL